MKKIVGVLSVLVALCIAWYLFSDGGLNVNTATKELAQKAQDAVVTNVAPEEVAALAVKAINLTQGENGAELWRLKANWGNMRRRDNIMELEKPDFTYYMPPDNKAITVASNKGELEQAEHKIRFVDAVVASYDGRVLYTPELLYFGKPREIVCPRGGKMTGEGYEGSADSIVWRMNDQIIEAVGGIDVFFEKDPFAMLPEQPATPEARDEPEANS